MTQSDIARDRAYVRDMARAGAEAPLLGGRMSLWWGGLAALALLGHWAILTGRAGLDMSALGFLWAGFGVVGGLGSVMLAATLKRKPGQGSAANRAEKATWTATAVAIFAYAIGAAVAVAADRAPLVVFDTIPLVALAVFAVSFRTVGVLAGQVWMSAAAAASALAALVGVWFVGTSALYLYLAAVTGALTIMSGVIQLTREPAALPAEGG